MSAHSLHTPACLLIFDVHQNIKWVEAILKKEAGRFDHLILGGDYFDTTESNLPGPMETAEWLFGMHVRFGSRLTILLGNHDIQYREVESRVAQHQGAGQRRYGIDACFTMSRAKRICRILQADFWNRCRFFQLVNGYLVSHAGVHPRYWPKGVAPEESLEELETTCQRALRFCDRMDFPILHAGRSRGGEEEVGGITWLDWEDEFVDELPYPQIVGHTRGFGPRNIGLSWCLDGSQTCWGLLDGNGQLHVRTF
jgi:hypothetical protein